MAKIQKQTRGKVNNRGRKPMPKDSNGVNESCKRETYKGEGQTSYGKGDYNANDPQWYIPNEQLLNDVAAIPYSIPLGSMVDTGFPTPDTREGTIARCIPGVMAINMYPGPGRSNSVPDAINVAANMIYSKIRANISGTRPYDAPDVMMYLMGADHAYMYLSWMQRLYGLMNVYSSVNKYLPKALIEAQGVNFENLRNNLSSFRYYINNFALQLASLYVPADIPLFKRHYWLYQNVWADSDSAMGQIYLYTPAGFGTYEEKTSEKGGFIKFNGSYGYGRKEKWTTSVIAVFGDHLLENLIYSEDVGTISGDIRRTYGDSHSLVPTTIDETYSVVPSYNKEVLSQIENMFSLGVKDGTCTIKSLDVTQDPNTNHITWDLTFTAKDTNHGKRLIQFYSDADHYYLSSHGTATNPADNIVMTRFMNACHFISGKDITITSCGSEIVLDIDIILMEGVNTTTLSTASFFESTWMSNVIAISKFDWHPIIYIFGPTANPEGKYDFRGVVADLDTFTVISDTQITRLNDMACMGLFNVPYRG